jgi:hypothetical protein
MRGGVQPGGRSLPRALRQAHGPLPQGLRGAYEPRGGPLAASVTAFFFAFFFSGTLVALTGCVRHIDMGVAPTASSAKASTSRPGTVHADATVLYTGVRDASRRYADYGVIDRSVLQHVENP